jgi:hypothetical protein
MAIMKASQKKVEAMMEACPEKTEDTDLDANPEEIKSVVENQEVLMKRPQWKLSEYWRTDMGTSIYP